MAGHQVLTHAPVVVVKIHFRPGDLANIFAMVIGIQRKPLGFGRYNHAFVVKLVLYKSPLVLEGYYVSPLHPFVNLFSRCTSFYAFR